ncbi:MAG: adenylosuccinate lyase [Deltaproteobacteria bacterium]|nr:adenylosuccinate lyase [Deltaproteobacteria bacterium]MCB9487206.1 adenylosuccinate lyase [Deltaproteobacteria bacterium]
MIPRYTREEMGRIWSDENRFRIWLDVEIAATEALVELGKVPAASLEVIKAKANFDPERVLEIEKETRHDVIAFLTNVAEYVGEDARFLHLGMTSSDVLDTAFAVQLTQAADMIDAGIDSVLAILKRRAYEFKDTLQMGRSHGIHAEPITFGLKLALWYDEMKRNKARLAGARERIAVGMISGAVGTFAHLPLSVEEHVCKKLGLKPSPVSSQIIQRDRHAEYFGVLAVIASSLDTFATEVRHLQRTEVYEAEEFFHKGQKGSSAMPHKRNPVLSENVSGLARIVRSAAMTALQNQALWHERDISHSSAERIIGPDATIALDFMLHRMAGLLDKLLVYPDRMRKNMEITSGLYASQTLLLHLVESGVTREDAYRMVQRNAMKVWEEGADFEKTVLADEEVMARLTPEQVRNALDPTVQVRRVDEIFARVFS